MTLVCIVFVSACGQRNATEIDKLNEKAYAFHYRNLDSTMHYAGLALKQADGYDDGAAEALNHIAFVCIARMQYNEAEKLLTEAAKRTDNLVELLATDVQLMRLCQRRSRNKDFYNYRERALLSLRRIESEPDHLNAHQRARLTYAMSEFHVVGATYYYYVGQTKASIDDLAKIDPEGDIREDTAQLLCYWYNIGAGGILTEGTPAEIARSEFDYLVRCYQMAEQRAYPFWEAQALQAMSEHLQQARQRTMLLDEFTPEMRYINADKMPDSLLAGNLAQRAYDIFRKYGDVYQTAGANRTLAECYWQIRDYRSALICLQRALGQNTAIEQAPDLVASIREQLSLVYSAVDDKVNSDHNRNIYLDLQEQTRQDRQLEARAAQLDATARQLNIMLVAVIIMIAVVLVLLYIFDRMRRRNDEHFALDTLLEPLRTWQKKNEEHHAEVQERYEELQEEMGITRLHLRKNKRRNLEQRAKVQLVNSILPFIDRMVNEVRRLQADGESMEVRQQRYQYIAELTDSINEHNDVLTQWIQMRQGEVSLKIESFALQPLLDIVARGRMGFRLKGVDLEVLPSAAVVKADKILTLFMINTIADNARKFTPEGGKVTVSVAEAPDYQEISVCDTGKGMDEETLAHIFDRTYTGGHGFGLKNCNGIIEKYKKISHIFHVCTIQAESEVGKGTRVFFRLPKGVVRALLALIMFAAGMSPAWAVQVVRGKAVSKAAAYADSAYFSNINGTYQRTLAFADSCHKYLAKEDTATLLDISNETAVAALALHRWGLYHKSNSVYTHLFREASADNTLPEYVRSMQVSENNKNVAVGVLVLLLIIIFPAYYFMYYRHRLSYRFCIDRINAMNRLLLSDTPDAEKRKGIDALGDFRRFSLSGTQQQNLNHIVEQIRKALQMSIEHTAVQEAAIEMAGDDLRRLQMDNDRLHVSNSVLDNCLSTLKHETMYYPSRIRQLIDGTDGHLEGIAELSGYYQELYQILSEQTMKQVLPIRLDTEMYDFLFDILKKVNNGKPLAVEISEPQGHYVKVSVPLPQCHFDEAQCRELFTPHTADLNFMLCRQIVREMGEATNLRACGIMAELSADGVPTVVITMPERCIQRNHISKEI
jgi:signal transduction histidine kinase